MNKVEELYNQLVEKWRTKGGNGSIDFGPNVNSFPVILGVLYKLYERDPTTKVLIIVDTTDRRYKLIDYLTHTDVDENNKEFEKLINNRTIRILTEDIANSWACNEYFYFCCFVGVNNYSLTVRNLISKSKFHLVCFTANSSTRSSIVNLVPLIGEDEVNELEEFYKTSPVEESRIGVVIDRPEDIDQLKKYDEYLAESMKIFGDFDRLKIAINGEPRLNISAIQFCTDIARNNGWNENLDMSIEHNKMIDMYFNPNALSERAKLTHSIRLKRSQLLSDNNSKLETIYKICSENPSKNILIINKTSDFAKVVTGYLNSKLTHYCNGHKFFNACYNYHENVDEIYDTDDFGNRIKVKSGKLKGTYKVIKGKAQMTKAEEYFNRGLTHILSTNNAPNKDLCCNVDLLIITSPLCETIETYRYRLRNVVWSDDTLQVVKIYCKGTLEERRLEKEKPSINHKIVNNDEKSLEIDENLGAIIVT